MRIVATVALAVALLGPVEAQRSSRWDVMDASTVTRTLAFAAGGGRTLDVRNFTGFIHLEPSGDSSVHMSIRKEIRAATREDVAEAERDVRLEFSDAAARIGATVIDRGGHVCGEDWNDREDRWHRVRYSVRYDFTVRVPDGVALRLCTINGGDVIVNGRYGDFLVDNVNGPIEINGVAGAGRAHTVNGGVKVTFAANPAGPSSFKTVNGNVDVWFRDGLDADFAMKTMNGGLYTDFDSEPLAGPTAPAGERRNGTFVYRANQHTRVRVGSGGPVITFETLNGNVRARRGER